MDGASNRRLASVERELRARVEREFRVSSVECEFRARVEVSERLSRPGVPASGMSNPSDPSHPEIRRDVSGLFISLLERAGCRCRLRLQLSQRCLRAVSSCLQLSQGCLQLSHGCIAAASRLSRDCLTVVSRLSHCCLATVSSYRHQLALSHDTSSLSRFKSPSTATRIRTRRSQPARNRPAPTGDWQGHQSAYAADGRRL